MIRAILLAGTALVICAAAPNPGSPSGATIVAQGTANGVLPCMACHGPDLAGNPSIGAPRIAGLPVATTLAAFHAIAAGRMGDNYVMKNVAHALTAPERAAVAAYLATLPAGTP